MHHPEPDGCISKHLHGLAAVWAGFGGLSHHVSLSLTMFHFFPQSGDA